MQTFEKLFPEIEIKTGFQSISANYDQWELSLNLKYIGAEKFTKVSFPGKVFLLQVRDEVFASVGSNEANHLPSIGEGQFKGWSFPILEIKNSERIATLSDAERAVGGNKLRHFTFISGNEIVDVLTDQTPTIEF